MGVLITVQMLFWYKIYGLFRKHKVDMQDIAGEDHFACVWTATKLKKNPAILIKQWLYYVLDTINAVYTDKRQSQVVKIAL